MSSDGSRSETGVRTRTPVSRAWVSFAVDLGLAALVALVELGPVIADAPPWHAQPFSAADALRLTGLSLPLLVRRRYPVTMLAIVLASFAGSEFLGPGLAVAFYSLGAWCDRKFLSRVTVALGVAIVSATFVTDRNVAVGGELLIVIAAFGGAWYLGDLSRVRREYAAMLEERAMRLERDREDAVREAAASERTRIARELHDIVAHRVSMMTIQAGAAGVVAESDPQGARRSMAAVESAGRQTLSELRRLVDVLRARDEKANDLEPNPGLDRLESLVNDVNATGIPTRLRVLGSRVPLPESLEISAYRIVQEALTNVMRHAGSRADADVVLKYTSEGIEIEVSDTGAGPTHDAGGGYGLVGMRERVALFGGELQSGPRPGGGFLVRARLPLAEKTS